MMSPPSWKERARHAPPQIYLMAQVEHPSMLSTVIFAHLSITGEPETISETLRSWILPIRNSG